MDIKRHTDEKKPAASSVAQRKARKHFLKNSHHHNTDSLQGFSWTNTFTGKAKQNQSPNQRGVLSIYGPFTIPLYY